MNFHNPKKLKINDYKKLEIFAHMVISKGAIKVQIMLIWMEKS
jgi:hypothetical protein